MRILLFLTLFLFAVFASDTTLGVATELIENPSTLQQNTSHSFPTASTYKLPIAIAFLHLVEQGQFHLDQGVQVLPEDIVKGVSPLAETNPHGGNFLPSRLIGLMITESDNSASDAVLRLSGGPAAITKFLRDHGIQDLTVATFEREMPDYRQFLQNTTTPAAMVQLLAALYRGELLNKSLTAYLVRTLEQTKTFPGRIKGLLPAGTVVAHKTGTGGTHNGIAWATNDVGIITLPNGKGYLAIAVYLENSRLDDAARDRIIALEAKKAYETYTNTKPVNARPH